MSKTPTQDAHQAAPSGSLRTERHGFVQVVTIDAPDRSNALDNGDLDDLVRLCDAIDADSGIRAVVLAATGRSFCAGYDLRALVAGAPASLTDNPFPAAAERLARLRSPVVAAINGPVAGAGVHMALACDVRIAVPDATMRLPAANLGIMYDPSAIFRIARELGLGLSRRLLLGAESLGAADLLAAGVFAELVAPTALLERALERAGRMAELAPLAVSGMKRVLDGVGGEAGPAERFRALQLDIAASPDVREALAAVSERRRPVFQGAQG